MKAKHESRRTYEKPELTSHGAVELITLSRAGTVNGGLPVTS